MKKKKKEEIAKEEVREVTGDQYLVSYNVRNRERFQADGNTLVENRLKCELYEVE